jgi:glycosyltransferase involved in cell wall biosynthesis
LLFKKKIVTVAYFSNHANIVGGGELSFVDLVNYIRLYNVKPLVFVPGKGEVYDRLLERNISPCIYSLPQIRVKNSFRLIFALLIIVRALLQYKVNYVHTNGARCMLIAGVAAWLCRIPVIWHVRVLERDSCLDNIRGRLATKIIANSGAVAASLQQFNNPQKVIVIHNGIDVDLFKEAIPVNLQKEFNLPDHPVILAVGRLCAWKRFHVLIKACGILHENGMKCTCLIIGQDAEAEPEYCKMLRSMPAASGLSNIVFGNWRTNIPSIMKSAKLLALPSDREPFGRVIIEAWACGLPVIATNAGGPAELINHGDTGMLIPIDDPEALARTITLLLADEILYRRIVDNGCIRVMDFSIKAHAEKVASLYV